MFCFPRRDTAPYHMVMEHPTPIQRPATVRHRTSLFCDAVAIVEAEYSSDLSLDEIARRVASSRRQLQRSYSEIGDTTFREHLTSVRMERAAELLTTRGLTVREVAQRVGYRQPAQFAKAFRRHHGLAPSAFRDTRRFPCRLGRAGRLNTPAALARAPVFRTRGGPCGRLGHLCGLLRPKGAAGLCRNPPRSAAAPGADVPNRVRRCDHIGCRAA